MYKQINPRELIYPHIWASCFIGVKQDTGLWPYSIIDVDLNSVFKVLARDILGEEKVFDLEDFRNPAIGVYTVEE